MARPTLTGGTRRTAAGVTAMGVTGAGTAICAPVTRALAAIHVTVVIRVLKVAREGAAWARGPARTRCSASPAIRV